MTRRRNILAVYFYRADVPARAAIYNHLYCFRRYAADRFFYVNLAVGDFPPWLRSVRFDLVILHTLFLEVRGWFGDTDRVLARAAWLDNVAAPRVMLPQDEHSRTDFLLEVIRRFRVNEIFSAAPESEWSRMYPGAGSSARFRRALPGYLDDDTLRRIQALSMSAGRRDVDVGYRARKEPYILGSWAMRKWQLADRVREAAERAGLRIDISTRPEDTFRGDDWYRFLLRCKYTLGTEGGAGLLDRDGVIWSRCMAFLKERPDATFEEVEAACFPGMDGSVRYRAISPRHLEACATRTCQVLVEGEYNGILIPGRHYIELKADFSNLAAVLETIRRDDQRERLTQAAYRDIVESGLYSYRHFVTEVLETAREPVGDEGWWTPLAHRLTCARDRWSWVWVWFDCRIGRPARKTLRGWLESVLGEERVRVWRQRAERGA